MIFTECEEITVAPSVDVLSGQQVIIVVSDEFGNQVNYLKMSPSEANRLAIQLDEAAITARFHGALLTEPMGSDW